MEKIKKFILNHKKLSIIVASVVILAIVLICIFCFWGNSEPIEPIETKEDKLRRSVKDQAVIYVGIRYSVSHVRAEVTTIDEIDNGSWEVYGKLYASDKYSDNYSGTFNGTCIEVIEDGEENFDCDLDYSELYKSR